MTVVVLLDRLTDASTAWDSFCREFFLPEAVLHLAERFTVLDRRSQLSGLPVAVSTFVVERVELRLANDDAV
jgi:hypothetical protein